jgi:hypothetical protein
MSLKEIIGGNSMAQKGKLGTKLTLDKVKGNTPLTKEGKCGITHRIEWWFY